MIKLLYKFVLNAAIVTLTWIWFGYQAGIIALLIMIKVNDSIVSIKNNTTINSLLNR